MTFWEHLDEMRNVLLRTGAVVLLFALLAFINKEFVFDIVFAPHRSDFITYRLFCRLGALLDMPSICPGAFNVELINTQLAAQFLTHMSLSIYAGFLLAFPYLVYELFGFVKPALYARERRYAARVICAAFMLFFAGVLLSYFLIFPLSFRFLATYQVSPFVLNKITLSSYISAFTLLSIMLGAVFEIPVLAYFFAKTGLLNAATLKRYRKHAFIAITLVAALITPTGDAVTLLLVAVPIYLLYELSISVVKRSARKGVIHAGNHEQHPQ